MNTAEILSMVSRIAYVVAGISLVLALFFWFKFKIPSVISDLSGRTARKSIAKIREHNAKQQGTKTGTNRKQAPAAKAEKANTASKTVVNKPQAAAAAQDETALLSDKRAVDAREEETLFLNPDESTCLLDEEATSLLIDHHETPKQRGRGMKMTMLDEVILVHTDEVL